MNILMIIPSFPEEDNDNIYTQLAEELNKKHTIKVVTSVVKREQKTNIYKERNLQVLRIQTQSIFKANLISKALAFIKLPRKYKKAIKKYLKNEKYDLILFMAPPVTLGSIIKYCMKKFNAKSYLMQKDIFPQNAVDLGIIKKWSPVYWYFKFKERKLYKTATKIGCMSQGNINYLLKHNKYLKKEKLEILPNNAIEERKQNNVPETIRAKYGIGKDKILAVYGGNFGKPQGIDFIINVLNEYKKNKKVVFFFAGKGTEQKRLFEYIKNNDFKNVITSNYVPKEEYNAILNDCDIGLIFLDYRFTIPNIPSRTLSYFQHSIPIMAATDKNTDYKDILVNQAKAGLWCESNDIEEFKKQFDFLVENKEARTTMGQNGRKYLEDNWTVDKSAQILENTYNKLKKEGMKNV